MGVSLRVQVPQCSLNTRSIFIGSEINNREEIVYSGFFPVCGNLCLVTSSCQFAIIHVTLQQLCSIHFRWLHNVTY